VYLRTYFTFSTFIAALSPIATGFQSKIQNQQSSFINLSANPTPWRKIDFRLMIVDG